MAENLLLEINPVLLEAMELSGDSGKLSYFQLLGLNPDAITPAGVDKAVMARSRALRQWQNSPQHGDETQKLLPMLHRIAAVLKDPKRREAYAQEVNRLLSGAGVDHVKEFQEMVRAALSDGVLDQASKAELLRYATGHNISHSEAGRILNEITAVMGRKAEDAGAAAAWEFRLAEGETGPGAFRSGVLALLEGSAFNPDSRERMLSECGKFGISRDSALGVLDTLVADHFRLLAANVARGGVLSDNQAKLLMPKARNFGIEQSKAYEILSEFTFTSASEQDIATLNLSAVGFDSGEITNFLAKQQNILYRPKRGIIGTLFGVVFSPMIITGLIIVGGIGGAIFFFTQFSGSGSYGPAVISATPTPKPQPPAVWARLKPDPADSMLPIGGKDAGGAVTFKIRITEVTCAEYQKFLKAMFYPNRPPAWEINYDYPQGAADLPVTGVSWADAMEFCKWKARGLGLAPDAVRLPTVAEFQALLAAPIKGGALAGGPDFWSASGMNRLTSKSGVMANKQIDALYFPNGQVYDLLGNVAEWGTDEKDGQRVVLGGDFTQTSNTFNPAQPQWRDPKSADDKTGFRYVVPGS